MTQTDTRPALTRTQRRILDVIRDSVNLHGYPPSMREIGAAVGLASSSSVAHQLTVLHARGYIVREVNRPRALAIVDDPGPGPDAVLRDAGRELINVALTVAKHPHSDTYRIEQAQAWDRFALALDAAEDAHRGY